MSDQDKKPEESPENKEGENNQNNQEQNPQTENLPNQENQNPEVNNQEQNPQENPQEQHQEQENHRNSENNNQPEQAGNSNENNNINGEEMDDSEKEGENGEEGNTKNADGTTPNDKDKKRFNKAGIEDIQRLIQAMTKKIEHEKINLRITTERLTQKEKIYNELQGKPVNKTNEEKEKERKEHKKAVKNHKLSDPIIRKKGKEKEFYDEQIKNKKAYDKSKTDFEKLTCDINELIIDNKDLRQQIVDLRKRKVEAQKQLETIMEENKKSQEELDEILKDNKTLKNQIKHKEYKEVVDFGNEQEKNFVKQRDDYENQYHNLIKDYIRREKEAKKENAKKRQMALLGSGIPSHFKGLNDKDIEKQIKMLAEEEISDRTPILDLEIEKWTEINASKKITIERHYENCVKIEDAFKKLTNFLGLDNFNELPGVFRKTEQQISNINIYNEKLDLQIDQLEQKKDSIIEQIKLLSGKQSENTSNKHQFKEQKVQSIKNIENLIVNFESDIDHKRELFKRIQPSTDNYLAELGESYLADFIPNKTNIDSGIEYNEQTVNKYLANVQDYYKLVQTWDEANRAAKSDENKELDRLREEMKTKLGGFEKNRILSKKLITSMKNDLKIGINIEDIIKKTSLEITSQPNLNTSFASNPYKAEKQNNSSMMNSQMPTDMVNNSGSRFLSGEQNQSNLLYPNNNSMSFNKNNSSAQQEEKKVPESS